jgi:hypothetical protein
VGGVIPFNETREYVKRVLANTMLYAHLLNQTYVPLSTRLGLVPPRGSDAPLAPLPATDDAPMAAETILVVGGSGFVGRHVVNRLVAGGHKVVVPTRRPVVANPLKLLPTVDIVECDVSRPGVLARLVERASAVDQPRRHPERIARGDLRAGARRAPAEHRRGVRLRARAAASFT